MLFQIGDTIQEPDAGTMRGKPLPVACECWFTSSGKMIPLMLKVRNEDDGEIITIRNIQVNYYERKNYAGVPTDEFDCRISLLGQMFDVKLVHYLTDSKWTINFQNMEGKFDD